MSHRTSLAAIMAATLYAALSAFAPRAQAQSATAGAAPAVSPSSAAAPAPSTTQASPAQPGMVVVRDPRTGQLRAPTPAEARALAPAPSAATRVPSQPALVTHPGGARQVRLGERGLVYSVVTRSPDGKLAGQCVHGAAAADKALAPSPSSTAHTEEHDHDAR